MHANGTKRSMSALKEKIESFGLKNLVTVGTKILSIWLKHSPITRNTGSNFSSTCDSIF